LNHPLLDSIAHRSLSTISDIASKLEIHANFTIAHERYLPLEVAVEVVNSLQQLPAATQYNYRRLQLQNFLDRVYFSGGGNAYLLSQPTTEPQQLENNTARGLNIEFDRCLRANNCGTGFFDPGWQVKAIDRDGSMQVTKDRLTLSVTRDRHLPLAQRSVTVGETIDILLPSNTIDNRYYLAIGNAGKAASNRTVEIYFNVSVAGAIELMEWVTRSLNQIELPFIFRVVRDPDNYLDCCDVAILTVDRQNYREIEPILKHIYQLNTAYFRPSVPAFTKLLAPGLSIAESPDSTAINTEDFGKYCCRIIADALLSARQQNDESPTNRQLLIRQFFTLQELNWERPYLHGNSQDIYTAFDRATGIAK
jgi:HopA1 effector protein family